MILPKKSQQNNFCIKLFKIHYNKRGAELLKITKFIVVTATINL